MEGKSLRSTSQKTLVDSTYIGRAEFRNGRLPDERTVIESMVYLLRPDRAGKSQRSTNDAARMCAYALIDHWVFCNIYTITVNKVTQKIEKLYKEFVNNCQTRAQRRNDLWKSRMNDYNKRTMQLFDISTTDTERIKRCEDEFLVKMSEKEYEFLKDQRGERIGYCDTFVDRKWKQTMNRKIVESERFERLRKRQEEDRERLEAVSWDDVEDPEASEQWSEFADDSEDFSFENSESSGPSTSKKRKRRQQVPCPTIEADDMPAKWRHIRESEKKVKEAFYKVVDKLISVFHCSKIQAIAAVIETANYLFGRQWKYHDEDEDFIDFDTAPCLKTIRETGKAIEAFALKCIVDEMMKADDVVITYHDDGSKKKDAGSFSVQGLTINGVFRALPTLPVASESRDNLAALKKAVLGILSICSGVSSKDLFNKINFRMMDSTAHNYGVDEQVALDLGTDHIPEELLCSTHPTLMFNREMIGVCSTVETTIGRGKIHCTLLVDATTTHDTVCEQLIDVMMRLVSHDFDSKPWNKALDFEKHISPKRSKAVALKKERFNRLVYAAAVSIHHGEDIVSFLNKFEHITNSLACVVRALQDVECLQVMILGIAIIGQHLHEPFLSLTYYGTVPYEKLIPAMQQLYVNLTTCSPEDLLDFSRPAFSFVSQQRFDSCKWDTEILDSIRDAISSNRAEVIQVLKLMLPKLAEGWHRQRGDVFGFGEYDPESPKLLLKKNMEILNKAPTHNMDGERQVARVQYGLEMRGLKELPTVSSSIVKSQSFDLIESEMSSSIKEYRTVSKKKNALVQAWKRQQDDLATDKLSEKEIQNRNVDKRRNQDLEKLKKAGGPFTSADGVKLYMDDTSINETEKISRLYTEIRYARDTSLSLPKSSDIFRLKRKYKHLPINEYATNLCIYLDKIQTNASATMDDFRSVLDNLAVLECS